VLEPGLELLASALGGLADVKNRPLPSLLNIEYALRAVTCPGGGLTLDSLDTRDIVSARDGIAHVSPDSSEL
jgi:hypothetical protein